MSETIKLRQKRYKHTLSGKDKGGFTIVELIVSAVIILIIVVAIVSVVRMGTELRVTDYNRRQARSIIMNEFETAFQYNNYPGRQYPIGCGDSEGLPPCIGYVYTLTDGQFAFVDGADVIRKDIAIDARAGIKGEMTVTVKTGVETGNGTMGTVSVSVHIITITLVWTEVTGQSVSIELIKQLAGL